jgi:hypothetical protein
VTRGVLPDLAKGGKHRAYPMRAWATDLDGASDGGPGSEAMRGYLLTGMSAHARTLGPHLGVAHLVWYGKMHSRKG